MPIAAIACIACAIAAGFASAAASAAWLCIAACIAWSPPAAVAWAVGAGPGIIEAANRCAHEAGGRSVGLGIALPFEQEHNPYVTPELDLEFHYFFVRKYWFLYLAKALVAFPGGFGTFD